MHKNLYLYFMCINTYKHIYFNDIHTYNYICIYIHTYIERERDRAMLYNKVVMKVLFII